MDRYHRTFGGKLVLVAGSLFVLMGIGCFAFAVLDDENWFFHVIYGENPEILIATTPAIPYLALLFASPLLLLIGLVLLRLSRIHAFLLRD